MMTVPMHRRRCGSGSSRLSTVECGILGTSGARSCSGILRSGTLWMVRTRPTEYKEKEEAYGHYYSACGSGACHSVWHSDFDFPTFFELFRGDLADSARTPGLGRGTLTLSSMDRQTTQYGPIPRSRHPRVSASP